MYIGSCSECDAEVSLEEKPIKGEVLTCPGCGASLEVVTEQPLTFALAPEEQEDWGE